jgi:hypothetical protein
MKKFYDGNIATAVANWTGANFVRGALFILQHKIDFPWEGRT